MHQQAQSLSFDRRQGWRFPSSSPELIGLVVLLAGQVLLHRSVECSLTRFPWTLGERSALNGIDGHRQAGVATSMTPREHDPGCLVTIATLDSVVEFVIGEKLL